MKRALFTFALSTALLGSVIPGEAAQQGQSRSTSAVLNEVKDLYKQKDFQKAISLLEDRLKQRPQDYQLWVGLGRCQEGAGNYRQAIVSYRKAQSLKLGLADVANRIINLDKIIKDQSASYTADPTLPPEIQKARSLFQQAKNAKSLGKFDEAFPLFIEAADLDPNYLSEDDGFIRTALNFYRAKLKSEDTLNGRYLLGVYLQFASMWDEASAEYKHVLSSKPEKDLADKTEARLKAINEARKKLAAAQALEASSQTASAPKTVTIKPALVKAPLVASDTVASGVPSIVEEERAALSGASKEEMLNRAMELRSQKKPTEALNIVAMAVSNKEDPDTYLTLGDLYMESNAKENVKAAIAAYRKVMTLAPKSDMAASARKKILALQTPHEQRVKEVAEYFEKHGTDQSDQH